MENLKIFVVEDNDFFGSMLIQEITNYSNDITRFIDGADCLLHLQHNPDIIFVDYHLESDMNGFQVLQQIKAVNPDIHVVLLTGQDDINIAVDCMKFGAFDYIVKNEYAFDKIQLVINKIIKLNQILKERGGSSSSIISKVFGRLIPSFF